MKHIPPVKIRQNKNHWEILVDGVVKFEEATKEVAEWRMKREANILRIEAAKSTTRTKNKRH